MDSAKYYLIYIICRVLTSYKSLFLNLGVLRDSIFINSQWICYTNLSTTAQCFNNYSMNVTPDLHIFITHLNPRICGDTRHHPQPLLHRSFAGGTRMGLFPAPAPTAILSLVLLGFGGWCGCGLDGQLWPVGISQVGVEVGCFCFYLIIIHSIRLIKR